MPTGTLLGDLTDELPQNVHIKTYASSGPKSYAYRLSDGSCIIRLKGISLHFKNSQTLEFEAVRKIVFDEIDQIRTPVTNQIVRTKFDGVVYNRPLSKTYKKVFTKRPIVPDTFHTVPFGFRT